jgi:hypothetical protein
VASATPAPRTARTVDVTAARLDLDDVRIAVLDPDAQTRRALGSRPSPFQARDAWTREVIALVGRDTPTLDSSPQHASMDDVGLDL